MTAGAAEYRAELVALERRQLEIGNRIVKLRRLIVAIEDFDSNIPIMPLRGITNTIRSMVRSWPPGEVFTVSEVRRDLDKIGFPIKEYANFAACVHTTLKRIARQGEIISTGDGYIKGSPYQRR